MSVKRFAVLALTLFLAACSVPPAPASPFPPSGNCNMTPGGFTCGDPPPPMPKN